MNAPTILALYNQTFQSSTDFLAGFVARGEVADFLLQQLRLSDTQAPAAAQLLLGGRGMGKTSLLRRVAIGVAEDADLGARFVPLRFREEQYNVLTLADFWRNCAESLAEWCETNRPSSGFPALFDRLAATPEWRDADTVYEAFAEEARALGLRPLLLVDNLDIVISNISAPENWALRRALQAPGGPVLIAAATHAPEQIGDRDAAFYEFFRLHLLAPLSANDLIRCLKILAEKRGEAGKPVAQVVETEPQRLRALHAFTGGNPRVLALVYRLLESQSTHEALGDLEALLDQLTPYYKGRVEEYQTKLQRAVIDALALNWDPITAHALAAATGVEVTTISSQLTRLRNDGLIEEVELAGARAGYQMIERLFNIWYLMRHGTRRTRNRVIWLTKFLVLFYPTEELRRMAAGYAEARGGTRESEYYREALAGAMETIEGRRGSLGTSDVEEAGGEAQDQPLEEILASLEARCFEATLDAARRLRAMAKTLGASAPIRTAEAIFAEGCALSALGRGTEEIAAYDELLARFGDAVEPALSEYVAKALVNKCYRLAALGRAEEAIAACDEVLACLGNSTEPALREQVGMALFNKGVTLGKIGRAEEAIAAYDEVLACFGNSTEPALREQVGMALFNKGVTLGKIGRAEEAIATYDEVLARFGDANEPALREQVAKALVNKGATLGKIGRAEEAIATYDEVLARFGDANEPALREQVAKALVNKGATLGKIGRAEEAIAAYDEVLARFGDRTEPALREQVAMALFNMGATLGEIGRAEEAIAAYDKVLARFGEATEPALREQVAMALVNKSVRLRALGRAEDAIAAYDELLVRYGEATELALREKVAVALVNRGYVLAEDMGRFAEAADATRRALAIAPDQPAFVTFDLAWADIARGAPSEEVAPLREKLSGAPQPGLDLLNAGLALAADNFGAAVAALDRALSPSDGFAEGGGPVGLIRLLRLAHTRGYGEKLITHFETAGHDERLAPVYAALVALERGERQLLNFNPETRGPAETIYRRLVAPLRAAEPSPKKSASRRGRPLKRRGR